MLELYDATLDARYLERALKLQQETVELFWDTAHGGFFFTAADNEELLVRQREIYDGAIPSGNSVAAGNLVRLARLTGDTEFAQRADSIFSAFASEASRQPSAHSQLMSALQLGAGPSLEVVIVGELDSEDTKALLRTLRVAYLPQAAILLVPPGEAGATIRRLAPFTKPYEPVGGRAAAYVCRDFQCQLPTTDPEKLAQLLEEAITKPKSSG